MSVSHLRNRLFSQEYIAGRTGTHSMGEAQTDTSGKDMNGEQR